MEKKEGRAVGSDSLPNDNCNMRDLLSANKALSSTDRVASRTSDKECSSEKTEIRISDLQSIRKAKVVKSDRSLRALRFHCKCGKP